MQAATITFTSDLHPELNRGLKELEWLCPASGAGQSEAAIELDFKLHYWITGNEFYIFYWHFTYTIGILPINQIGDNNLNKNKCEIHSKVIVSQDYFDYWVRV